MKVYFLRHGIAWDAQKWKGAEFDRPLTGEGRSRMAREAKTIGDLGLELDAIVTSRLVRARETAEIVAQALDLSDRLVEDARMGLDFSPAALAEILRERAGAAAVMVVGHEPSMSRTIGDVIGGGRVEMKKGALACVEIAEPPAARGDLLWLIPPKVLARH